MRTVVDERRGQGGVGVHGCCSAGGKLDMSVRLFSFGYVCLGSDAWSLDFMAVRKIPMKRRPQLLEDLSFDSLDADQQEENTSEDPAVFAALSQIRDLLVTDRALHDKVALVCSVIPTCTWS